MMERELTEEQSIKVADLIRNDLTGRFGAKLKFDPITVTTRKDDFGERYCHIRVVYSGDANLLDPAWLNGFYRRNHLALQDCGVTDVTTETYVDKTEDSDWSDLIQVTPYVE